MLDDFPNLKAILEGRVSGHATEWIAIRVELRMLIRQRDRLERVLRLFVANEADQMMINEARAVLAELDAEKGEKP